jgi:hypothetical protein
VYSFNVGVYILSVRGYNVDWLVFMYSGYVSRSFGLFIYSFVDDQIPSKLADGGHRPICTLFSK